MTLTLREKISSRESTTGQSAQVDLEFVVEGTDDDLEAKAFLTASTPALYDSLVRQSVKIAPVGPLTWDGTVRYGRFDRQAPQTGSSNFSFDTGGGTQHITQSLQTVATYPGPTAMFVAPNFHGAIGVTQDSVEGVDITLPIFQFAETHYLAPDAVDNTYKGTLFRLTGKVNNASFKGLDAGECLFLGASGSRRGTADTDDWEITFKFAGSPNATGLTIGSITGINKKGWEYMWVRYEDAEDANQIVKKPKAVYIEKVYDEADLSVLGIGT